MGITWHKALTCRSGRDLQVSWAGKWLCSEDTSCYSNSHMGRLSKALRGHALRKCILQSSPPCGALVSILVHINLILWGNDGKIQWRFWSAVEGFSRKDSRVLGIPAGLGQLQSVEWQWTLWMGSPAGGCSTLFTTVVEIVAAATGASSESHCVRAGEPAEAQHGREVMAGHCRCRTGLKMQCEGLWGNRKCRAGCGLFNIQEAGRYLLACILSERSVHNLTVSLHVFFGPGVSSWCSLTRGKQRNHLSAVSS